MGRGGQGRFSTAARADGCGGVVDGRFESRRAEMDGWLVATVYASLPISRLARVYCFWWACILAYGSELTTESFFGLQRQKYRLPVQ